MVRNRSVIGGVYRALRCCFVNRSSRGFAGLFDSDPRSSRAPGTKPSVRGHGGCGCLLGALRSMKLCDEGVMAACIAGCLASLAAGINAASGVKQVCRLTRTTWREGKEHFEIEYAITSTSRERGAALNLVAWQLWHRKSSSLGPRRAPGRRRQSHPHRLRALSISCPEKRHPFPLATLATD